MGKTIKIFKSFEEQEMYYLEYFFQMTPAERLRELARVQKKNYKDFAIFPVKKITIKKHFVDGY